MKDRYAKYNEVDRNIDNYMDSDDFAICCMPASLTGTTLLMNKELDVDYPICQSGCIDFGEGTMTLYNKHSMGSTLIANKSKKISFRLVAKHQYKAELIMTDKVKVRLTLTDMFTFDSDYLEGEVSEIGVGWGKRTYTFTDEGKKTAPMSAKCFSTQPKICRCLLVGDSFIEGTSLVSNEDDRNHRYAYQIKKAVDGKAFINGRGGTSTEVFGWFRRYLMNVCCPQFAVIAVGMNESNYLKWLFNMKRIIQICMKNGIKPILVTVTANVKGSSACTFGKMNAWIRQSHYDYIDANRILSVGFEGLVQNGDYFYGDGIHPNVLGHDLIFKKAQVDVPYLFAEV